MSYYGNCRNHHVIFIISLSSVLSHHFNIDMKKTETPTLIFHGTFSPAERTRTNERINLFEIQKFEILLQLIFACEHLSLLKCSISHDHLAQLLIHMGNDSPLLRLP